MEKKRIAKRKKDTVKVGTEKKGRTEKLALNGSTATEKRGTKGKKGKH